VLSIEDIKDALLRDGAVYINVWSQDCDGVQSQYHREFKSVEEFIKWEVDFYEWAEGRQGYSFTDKDNLDEAVTWGGWGDY
jgi:hypothetical protein